MGITFKELTSKKEKMKLTTSFINLIVIEEQCRKMIKKILCKFFLYVSKKNVIDRYSRYSFKGELLAFYFNRIFWNLLEKPVSKERCASCIEEISAVR